MRSGTIYRSELFQRIGIHASGERVLDIGAFDGRWLATQPGAVRVGVDLDIRNNPNCAVVRGDGTCLPFPDDAFDSVFAFDVIEHVQDDRKFASELVRVTRPGGVVTITTPSAALRIFPARLTPWAHTRWGHNRCAGYEPEKLHSLFESAGARDVRVQELRAWAFLTFYLPLSALARLSQRTGRSALALAAAIDSRWRKGRGGFLLATARV